MPTSIVSRRTIDEENGVRVFLGDRLIGWVSEDERAELREEGAELNFGLPESEQGNNDENDYVGNDEENNVE